MQYNEIFIKNYGKIIITDVDLEEGIIIGINNGETIEIEKNNNRLFIVKNDIYKEEINKNEIEFVKKFDNFKELKTFFS